MSVTLVGGVAIESKGHKNHQLVPHSLNVIIFVLL